MNGRRKSPRLNKIKEPVSLVNTLSNSNEPTSSKSLVSTTSSKANKDRVNLLKNLKKITDKTKCNNDKLTTSQKSLVKNRGKFPKTRKTKKENKKSHNEKKSKQKRVRHNPKLPRRRSERLSNRLNTSPSSSSVWSNVNSSSNSSISSPNTNQTLPNLSLSSTIVTNSLVTSIMNSSTFIAPDIPSPATTSLILSESCVSYLKTQLKKATIKFDKACRQLNMLDQQMNDLQNSYSNSLENDRKTFKIIYRMQLATYEGAHNAYIQYIERQVEKIKKLKRLLFNDATGTNPIVDLSTSDSNEFNSTN